MDYDCLACQIGELHTVHNYPLARTPLCVDERGCPDEGSCRRALECPRRTRGQQETGKHRSMNCCDPVPCGFSPGGRGGMIAEHNKQQRDWQEVVRGWNGL